MKNIKNFSKPIIIVALVVLGLIGYYIYYKHSNTYEEFEEISNLEELLPYEEEYQKENLEEDVTEEVKMIMVHITGEVKNWGVIELEEGSRVIDAVNKAGGFTDSADVDKVNLAYVLSDGIKIYIPSKMEENIGEFTTSEYISSEARG